MAGICVGLLAGYWALEHFLDGERSPNRGWTPKDWDWENLEEEERMIVEIVQCVPQIQTTDQVQNFLMACYSRVEIALSEKTDEIKQIANKLSNEK